MATKHPLIFFREVSMFYFFNQTCFLNTIVVLYYVDNGGERSTLQKAAFFVSLNDLFVNELHFGGDC